MLASLKSLKTGFLGMGKTLPWVGLIALATILATISVCEPAWLNDNNEFLKGFVNYEFLATLGFVAAVTLASAANVHLELNRLEDETDAQFVRTRNSLKRSVISLVVLLGVAVALVAVKPLLNVMGHAGAVVNGTALLIVYFYVVTLYDLTAVVFRIPTKRKIQEIRGGDDTSGGS